MTDHPIPDNLRRDLDSAYRNAGWLTPSDALLLRAQVARLRAAVAATKDTSHPNDLVSKLTSATDDPGRFVDQGKTLGVPCEPLCEWQARATLIALAEWADGALIDPNGWRRLDAVHVCDGDWDDAPERPDESFPVAYNWTDEAGPMCAGAPLHTLTERADQ